MNDAAYTRQMGDCDRLLVCSVVVWLHEIHLIRVAEVGLCRRISFAVIIYL